MSLALIKLTKCGAGINAISGCGYCLAKMAFLYCTVFCKFYKTLNFDFATVGFE